MTEKKRNDQHDDSYYDELIKQRIGEALRNQSRKERLDLAQLEAWVEADRQKRRAKMKRILAIASCFIIICAGTFSLKFAFDDDAVATAGKNDNKVNEKGNNAVVKPNEEDAGENVGENTITCKTWEAVGEAQKTYADIKIPKYVPKGYEFKTLYIEKSEAGPKYIFSFVSNEKKIEITQIVDADVTVFNNYDKKIIVNDKPLYIKEQDGKCGFYQKGRNTFYVLTECSDDILVQIIENLV